jgi:predicted thioesterase
MKPGIENGVGMVEVEVTDKMVARLDEKLIHPVYSTFWLAYHAEVASRRAIEPFFEEGEDAVGAEISLKHHAMAGIGARILIRASVSDISNGRIRCVINATSSNTQTLLADGYQDQVVLKKEVVKEKVLQAVR